jgi:hypothetical protein
MLWKWGIERRKEGRKKEGRKEKRNEEIESSKCKTNQ